MILFINNLFYKNKTFLSIIAGKTCKVIDHADLAKKDNRSENILSGIDKLLAKTNKKTKDLKGIIVVNGPGSFVGIRVALSVANTIAWANNIPVVGVRLAPLSPDSRLPVGSRESTQFLFDNEALIKKGLEKIKCTKKSEPVMPFYGKGPHITMMNDE